MQQGNPLVAYARQAAMKAGIDEGVFYRQIMQESGFDPNAGSPAGAQGIAQIMPNYHPGVDPYDPYASLDYAARLMASHLRNYNGDYSLALAAYNAGPGAVQQYGGVPPFEETQNYVATILGSGGPNISQLPNTGTGGAPPYDPYAPGPGIEGSGGSFDFSGIASWLGGLPDTWARNRADNELRIRGQSGIPTGGAPMSTNVPWHEARNAVVGDWGGAIRTAAPMDSSDPRHPEHWLYVYKNLDAMGKIPPFNDAASFAAYRASQQGSMELDNLYKRAQIADMERRARGEGADNAFRNQQMAIAMAQLEEQKKKRLAELRIGPKNWLQYWSESRDEPLDPAADQVPIEQVAPALVTGGGRPTNAVVAPPPIVNGPAWMPQGGQGIPLIDDQNYGRQKAGGQ